MLNGLSGLRGERVYDEEERGLRGGGEGSQRLEGRIGNENSLEEEGLYWTTLLVHCRIERFS